MRVILPAFFERNAAQVAPALVGCVLVRALGQGRVCAVRRRYA